jgi:redox-sensitive bicupin YhaK (pirin superfamily)
MQQPDVWCPLERIGDLELVTPFGKVVAIHCDKPDARPVFQPASTCLWLHLISGSATVNNTPAFVPDEFAEFSLARGSEMTIEIGSTFVYAVLGIRPLTRSRKNARELPSANKPWGSRRQLFTGRSENNPIIYQMLEMRPGMLMPIAAHNRESLIIVIAGEGEFVGPGLSGPVAKGMVCLKSPDFYGFRAGPNGMTLLIIHANPGGD